MGYTIWPYGRYAPGKQWNVSDEDMVKIFLRMAAKGLHERVFYMGEIKSPFDWLSVVKNPTNSVHLIVDDDNIPVAIAWLNTMRWSSALAHFCILPEGWGREKSTDIGNATMNYWWSMNRPDGTPIWKTIRGETPSNNRLALKFIQRIGFKIIGTIPNERWDRYRNEPVDLVYSYAEHPNGREQ